MPVSKKSADDLLVREALREFEIQALNFAYRFVNDAAVRKEYIASVKAYSQSAREAYDAGKITALQAEELAHSMRNQVMDMARARSSDFGRALAETLKDKGIPLEALVSKYAKQRFGKLPHQLTAIERDQVALEIVAASGRTNVRANTIVRRLGAAGRGLWVLTALIAIYNVGTAENKAVAAGREAANLGGGVLGGAAGGAVVGAAVTGPLAPVGAAIGAIVGGILGAAVADELYVEGALPLSPTVARLVPRFTHLFYRDEEGLAGALYDECGINMDEVFEIMRHLNEYYTTDADDVAHLYVELVRKHGGSVQHALKLHRPLIDLLIQTMESGWTDAGERRSIDFLQTLR